VDEADHRPNVTTITASGITVVCAAMILGVLCGWRVRPRPSARISARRTNRWLCLAGAGIAAALLPPVLGLVAGICAAIVRRWSRARRSARTTRRIAHDFPDALDLLVLSIRAGYLPSQAIVEITPFLPHPLRPSFTAVHEAMNGGDRFADALRILRAGLGPIAQPLVDSLSAADRYGLPLAPVLERLSFEARQQRRRDAETTARELPVRLAIPLVVCTLPSFVLLAIVPLLLGALSSL
jgi:tight adherence protein C